LIGCNAVRLRTFSLLGLQSRLFFGSFTATFSLNVVSMVLELSLLDAPSVRSPRNVINQAYLLYMWRLMLQGYKHTFLLKELPQELDSSEDLYRRFQEHWLVVRYSSRRYAGSCPCRS
jgi:hypothetical protein